MAIVAFVDFASDRQGIIGHIIFGLGSRPQQNGGGDPPMRVRDGRK